ncbi:MAG TPA: hypothetical protein PLC25_03170 [Bacilli bacterium]|nr:hypothetical protein [Bacilli bacterium]
MGSFYSTCSVSNMTLSSQKTSILILAPSYDITFKEHLNMIVSNDGAQAFFSPFGFPIHGVYDDYGYITNIKRDRNVEMIEEYFGLDIDSILQNIGRERDTPKNIKHKELYQTLGITYFRTEVLEYLERGWDKYDLVNPNKYTGEERLKKLLDHIENNGFNVLSPDKLVELVTKKVNKTISDDELLLYSNHLMSSIKMDSTYIQRLTKGNMFKELPITIDFKDEILKQYTMLCELGFGLRKNLIPSNYGSQEDNWTSLYKFNDFVNDLLVEDIKYQHERWGEDSPKDVEEIINIHKAVVRGRKINSIL